MKRFFLITIASVIMLPAFAGNNFGRQQKDDNNSKKFSFSFNAGVGIPTGGFANKDSVGKNDTTHAHGFANKGFHFEVGVSYRFSPYVGVALQVGGTLNPFDAGAYASAYKISSNYDVSSQGQHYIGQYLIGPYFFIPASDNLCFEIRALFGIVSAQFPDIEIMSNQPNNYSSQIYKFAHAQDFGYGISATARIAIDNMIGIPITVGYIGSNMRYPGQSYTFTTPSGFTYGGFSFSTRDMSLGIITITAGLSISF